VRRFLIILFIFSLCNILLFFLLSLSTDSYIAKKAVFKIKPNAKYLVFGNSHPECAFNDSLLMNFSNHALSGESFFYTFIKAKKIIENNDSLKAIFVGFDNVHIYADMDGFIWDDEQLIRYSNYLPFFNLEDHELIFSHNFRGGLNSISVSDHDNLYRILNKKFNFVSGGYLYLVRDKTDSLLKNYSDYSKNNLKLMGTKNVSQTNLNYLKKLIAYCRLKNIQVFLVRTPIHTKSLGVKYESTFKNILLTQFSNTEFLDFKDFPLLNSDFGDFEHLNFRGAIKFSSWFDNLMENGLLQKTNKQSFINDKIREINGY
jgi:hypothetical protein